MRCMAELRAGEDEAAVAEETGEAAHWRQTLWAMVGIQFVMTMAFSMLTPIMPLFLPQLGVHSAAAIDIWAGILSGITSFIAAFASPLLSLIHISEPTRQAEISYAVF